MRHATESIVEIALGAGQAIMAIYDDAHAGTGKGTPVFGKEDGSPLTLADLAAHRFIVEKLAALDASIPVVSEEDAASLVYRKPDGRFWLVDPLDGTKEFISGNGEFTVNIALIENGRPVLGVVYAPALDLMYWGTVGEGAWRRSAGRTEAIRVSKAKPGTDPVRIVASRSHMNDQTMQLIGSLGEHALIQAGSSLKFCRIAENAADLYPRLGPTCEWDTAAAQAVVEAAGGAVTTLDGTPLTYGKPELLNPHFIAAAFPWPLTAAVD